MDLDPSDPLRPLARALDASRLPSDGIGGFRSGWIVALSYELGRLIEPAAAFGDDRGTGLQIEMWRCDEVLTHDRDSGLWTGGPCPIGPSEANAIDARWSAGSMRSVIGRAAFMDAVRHTLRYIRAGDVYQVNLTHPLETDFAGSTRGYFADLAEASDPCFGAYLESENGAVASISPELFLEYDASTRTVRTRPMKGTRRGDTDPGLLDLAEKDRAELNMIVDLMRNDLGRSAVPGSVRVAEPRSIETHGSGVHQATATVEAELMPGRTVCDLLRAAFPPGSVTGAPKIRAMQIIEELEPHDRGRYCGAIGYIDDRGSAQFSVGIRTAEIARSPDGDRLVYPVGAGIVADSDPASEYDETMLKAEVLERLIRARCTQ